MTEKNGVPVVLPEILTRALCPRPDDPDAVEHHPILTELLWPIYHEGKLKREAGSLTLRPIGSDYMVTISCPTEKVQLSLVAHSMIDLLVYVETCLAAGQYTYDTSFAAKKRARHRLDRQV